MKFLLTILILFCSFMNANACGNEYGHTMDGRRMYTQYFYLSPNRISFDTLELRQKVSELEKKIRNETSSYKTWSDLALNLMKLGQVDSSIKILRNQYVEHPNEYNIMANLGTAYELSGQLDSAYKYISKGFKLNPKSHGGSEWIHVKILEGKIKEKKNPGWINSHEIVSLSSLLEKVDTASFNSNVDEVNQDFFYQLRTRFQYVSAPNKTMVNLLVTLGDFNAKVGTYENALLAYAYALRYQDTYGLEWKVKRKIKNLNDRRTSSANPKEIPNEFIVMMKRSQLSPELLLLGLDEYALKMDSINLSSITKQDSLNLMIQKYDSVASANKQQAQASSVVSNAEGIGKYSFILIGLLVGVVLTVVYMRRSAKG